jgi:hypothetical protein
MILWSAKIFFSVLWFASEREREKETKREREKETKREKEKERKRERKDRNRETDVLKNVHTCSTTKNVGQILKMIILSI